MFYFLAVGDLADYTLNGCLTAAVVVLWKIVVSQGKKQAEENALCEKKNEALQARVSGLEVKVAIWESCPTVDCGGRAAFRRTFEFSTPHVKEAQTHTQNQ